MLPVPNSCPSPFQAPGAIHPGRQAGGSRDEVGCYAQAALRLQSLQDCLLDELPVRPAGGRHRRRGHRLQPGERASKRSTGAWVLLLTIAQAQA